LKAVKGIIPAPARRKWARYFLLNLTSETGTVVNWGYVQKVDAGRYPWELIVPMKNLCTAKRSLKEIEAIIQSELLNSTYRSYTLKEVR